METFNYAQDSPPARVHDDFLPRPTAAPFVALCVALVALCGAACGPARPQQTSVPPLAGAIQVNEPDHDAWAAALRRQQLDAVQVTLYARQLAWDSAEMIVPDNAPGVISEIRAAKRAGLRVTLVLRVALEQALEGNRHYWHGMIWPAEDEIGAWFAGYRDFALWGAALAAAEDVDLLAVGSELNSLASTLAVASTPPLYAYFLDPARTAVVRRRLVQCAEAIPAQESTFDLRFVDGGGYGTLDEYLRAQEVADRSWTQQVTGATSAEDVDLTALNRRRALYESHWRALIAEVRTVYAGPLSYAANFDEVDQVGFWDALDVIGVNAYYPLSTWGLQGDDLRAALSASWRRIGGDLNNLADRHGGPARVLPVVIFELGWTRKAGSTVRPFSYRRVEVLETTSPAVTDGSHSLTCVHWATQPEDAMERVEALRALGDIVAEGGFPTLRGFMLWKLSTNPGHRAVEPFVVVVPEAGGEEADEADRLYLEAASVLAAQLRRSAGTSR